MNTRTLYRLNTSRINASFVLDVLRNGFPNAWKRFTNCEEEGETSDSLAMGTAVHAIFEEKVTNLSESGYIYVDDTPKSTNEEKLCLILANNIKNNIPVCQNVLHSAYEAVYKKTPNAETQRKRYTELLPYINVLAKNNAEKCIKKSFYYTLVEILTYVNNDFLLKNLIYSDSYMLSLRETIVMWTYKTIDGVVIDCKSMIDRLIVIDTEERYVVLLLDYKTHKKSNSEFEKSFVHWDYDIQSEFYEYAVKALLNRLVKKKAIASKPFMVIPMIVGVSFYDNSVEIFRVTYTRGKLHAAMALIYEHLKNNVYNESLISYKTRKAVESGSTTIGQFLIDNVNIIKKLQNDKTTEKVQ